MAEALAVALPSGYDDEFVNSVDEDLHCSICHLPLKEAVQTGKCGHRFCRQCLDEHFRRLELNREQLNCPVDRNVLIRDKKRPTTSTDPGERITRLLTMRQVR